MPFRIGDRVADYEVVQILGEGGMGRVYKVRNLISDRVEAMKVLLPDLQSDPALVDRFLREIKVQAALSHPNIASLHTALRHDNQLLMLMEFVEGQSLDKELDRRGRLPVAEACAYVEQVLRALSYAHGRGVIHRDLKPANIVLTPEGQIKLMDFGIAKLQSEKRLTQTGTTIGSLYYMSPEQINGREPDTRSDIYSLGITLYEMVTGKRPFEGPSDYSIMAGHLQLAPQAPIEIVPNVPPLLNEVILMALAKDPQQRFQSAEAFRTAILNVQKAMQPLASSSVSSAPGLISAASSPGTPACSTTPPLPAQPAAPGASSAPQPEARVASTRQPARRMLWMALGSLAAVLALAAGLTFGPNFFSSRANSPAPAPSNPANTSVAGTPAPAQQGDTEAPPTSNPEPRPTASASPALPPASTPTPWEQKSSQAAPPVRASASPPPQVNPANQPSLPASTPPVAHSSNPALGSPSESRTQPASAGQAASLPPQSDRLALEAQQDRMVKIASRAVAVRNKLQRLESQQNAMGLGMRADFKAALTRMEQYLDAAEDALKANDPARAKQNLDRADRDLEFLEEKLGIL
ncbi:MAG: protein kinase [Bryobacteraceae bacterium]|nr:protein kinase [Bryobacteraceae bacterium]MDW8378921.1 protein kinase [Bryobacterales bacterium]